MIQLDNLMLYDWVKIKDETKSPYRRIWAIDYPFDGCVYLDDYGKKDSYDAYNPEDIEPIPLTPEILEKNGWEKSIGENPVEVWTIGKGAYLHKTDNGYKLREGAEFNVPNIQYVHTLQHALRLCGLDELADNFQI